ncbi:hypothetical protein HYU15_00130 [Candidatus Woesearchaeota archaeon]|nr:hypothetical protein [Candidatus Woesearchaeota archaeon]
MVTTMQGYSTPEPDRYWHWPGRIVHVARIMAAVAEPDRLKTLDALVNESLSFRDLQIRVISPRTDRFIPSSTLFNYLEQLELSGLVASTQEPDYYIAGQSYRATKYCYEITELGRVVIDYLRQMERAMRGAEKRMRIKTHMAGKPDDADEERMAEWKKILEFLTGLFGEETA